MKKVDIEFVNIQSHEHTHFTLQPGLNFILAEDNNVGKSTIFKVLLCAMQLPQVSASDVDELIRGQCTQARATFRYDDETCTLWMFRGEGKASRAFFELSHRSGITTRSLNAPASLREALDIVSSEDGKVVNFNDADSVQLIVQDTPKNDEVLSKVLIDIKVDAIKANLIKLHQQIQQDYRFAKSKLDDVTTTLSTMHYVHEVDDFKSEKQMLAAACRIADAVCDDWESLDYKGPAPDVKEVARMRTALTIYTELTEVLLPESALLSAVDSDYFDHMKTSLHVLDSLDSIEELASIKQVNITSEQLTNAERGLNILDYLIRADAALVFLVNTGRDMERLSKERETIIKQLEALAPRVQCPVKGEVFYSDDQCVPCGDRPSL